MSTIVYTENYLAYRIEVVKDSPSEYCFYNIFHDQECKGSSGYFDTIEKAVKEATEEIISNTICDNFQKATLVKRLTMKEALLYAKDHVIAKDFHFNNDKTVCLFTDNTAIVAESDYEEDWSDVTPGSGIQQPNFYLYKVKTE